MTDLIRITTAELGRFFTAKLPELSRDWWQERVLDCLTPQQRHAAREYVWRTLQRCFGYSIRTGTSFIHNSGCHVKGVIG